MASPQTSSVDALEIRLRNARRLNVALAALSVFLLVVLVAVRSSDSSDTGSRRSVVDAAEGDGAPTGGAEDSADPADPGRSFADEGHPYVIGDPDAPVVLNEWVDMRCPFCAVFTNKSLPTIMERYVEPGHVRIEVHPISFFGDDSTNGVLALRAAADQDLFHEFMTTVYANAPDKGHPDHPNEVLLDHAREAGIPDLDAFEAGLLDADRRADVGADTSRAQQLGVQAVPFFVVGNQSISGAQPTDVFESLLDQALAEVGITNDTD